MMDEARLTRGLAIARLAVTGERDQSDTVMSWNSANAPRDLETIHPRETNV
jgi:hypothetical protein